MLGVTEMLFVTECVIDTLLVTEGVTEGVAYGVVLTLGVGGPGSGSSVQAMSTMP